MKTSQEALSSSASADFAAKKHVDHDFLHKVQVEEDEDKETNIRPTNSRSCRDKIRTVQCIVKAPGSEHAAKTYYS